MEVCQYSAGDVSLLDVIRAFPVTQDSAELALSSILGFCSFRLRQQCLSDVTWWKKKELKSIAVQVNKEANTLTLEDSGIGLSKSELNVSLGRVAKNSFDLSEVTEDNIESLELGFYNVFVIANKVAVSSKRAGFDQYTWEAGNSTSFTLTKDEPCSMTRGTKILLYLKDGMQPLVEEVALRELLENCMCEFDLRLTVGSDVQPIPKRVTWCPIIGKVECIMTYVGLICNCVLSKYSHVRQTGHH